MKVADILQSILVGIFLTLVLYCVFWAAIYNNYIHFYGIREFFNPFFGNVVNFYVFFTLAIILGIGFALPIISSVFYILYVLSLVFSLTLFVPSFGKYMGSKLLAKQAEIIVKGEGKLVNSIYENNFYIIYLSSEITDTDSKEDRERKLTYYEK